MSGGWGLLSTVGGLTQASALKGSHVARATS